MNKTLRQRATLCALAFCFGLTSAIPSLAIHPEELQQKAFDTNLPMKERLQAALWYEAERLERHQQRERSALPQLDVETIIHQGLEGDLEVAETTLSFLRTQVWKDTFGELSPETLRLVHRLLSSPYKGIQNELLLGHSAFELNSATTSQAMYSLASNRVWGDWEDSLFVPQPVLNGSPVHGAISYLIYSTNPATIKKFVQTSCRTERNLDAFTRAMNSLLTNNLGEKQTGAVLSGFALGLKDYPENQVQTLAAVEHFLQRFTTSDGPHNYDKSAYNEIRRFLTDTLLSQQAGPEVTATIRDGKYLRQLADYSRFLLESRFSYPSAYHLLISSTRNELTTSYLEALLSSKHVPDFLEIARLLEEPKVAEHFVTIAKMATGFQSELEQAKRLSMALESYIYEVMYAPHYIRGSTREQWAIGVFVHTLALLNSHRDVSVEKLIHFDRQYPYLVGQLGLQMKDFPWRTRTALFPFWSAVGFNCGAFVRSAAFWKSAP